MDADVSTVSDLLDKGDPGAAYALGAELCCEQPEHPRLAFLTGNAALQLGRYADAVAHFERADALHPEAAQIKNNLGAALLHNGDTQTAIETLRHAVRLKSDYTNARRNLASALKSAGALSGAEEQLDAVRQVEGDTAELIADLADLYRLQSRWDEAADAGLALFESDPANTGYREAAVEALIRTGNADQAAQIATARLP